MWRLCLNIRDVINTCDDTIHNLLAYVCDWSLGAHKILHPISSLKLGVTWWLLAYTRIAGGFHDMTEEVFFLRISMHGENVD